MATPPHDRQPPPVTRHSSHTYRVPSLGTGVGKRVRGVSVSITFLWTSSGLSLSSDVGVLSSALRLDWGWVGKNRRESPGWVTSPIRALGSLGRALCPSENITPSTSSSPPIGLSSRQFETVVSAVQCGADFCSCGSFVTVFLGVSCSVRRFGRVFHGSCPDSRLGRLDLMGSSWDGMSFVPPSGDVSCPAFEV